MRTPIGPGSWPRYLGSGWRSLLDDLHRELLRLDPDCSIFEARSAADGALELRFYAPLRVADQANVLVKETVATSRTVCEGCGDRGRLYGGPWCVTLCSNCAPR